MILLRYSDRSKKPGDSFRQQHERWRQAYSEASSLREQFPNVDELVLEIAFTDFKSFGTYSPQLRRFSPAAKAFFGVACPRTLCLDGGFDLDAIVRDLRARGATETAGYLGCQGAIHATGAEHVPCLLRLDYRLELVYEPRASRRSKPV
jgi:hypothetical protein